MHLALRCSRHTLSNTRFLRTSTLVWSRRLHTKYDDKYAEKLRLAAEKRGLSVGDLRDQVQAGQAKERREKLAAEAQAEAKAQPESADGSGVGRKDSSPIKPLSSLLNLPRVLSGSHTTEQISALWTVYHAARSNGTGRGFVCASIPLDLYSKMAKAGSSYPMFVVPVRREAATAEEATAHEVYFLQWSFHDAPRIPSAQDEDLFVPPQPQPTDPSLANPPISTVMFTPLQEYKMRGSFATPYLVLTFYTDLARTHGTVLLRGEITPVAAAAESAGASSDGRFMLSQEDAHRLAMSVQNFYLWDEAAGKEHRERETLVKEFHEKPSEFEWEKLLKYAV
ncbi:unnamed protein product [Mycena citricolor]|uniref:ATP11-domain-containing protein n=1 Tax=Mycena citricolor TaxID=2018698 RepID=A0AAD2GX04_9AGAR|nr:unnamed protein product [Mycena citricolor]